jgi:hypothetical protein
LRTPEEDPGGCIALNKHDALDTVDVLQIATDADFDIHPG